jgi:NAD(P)-dependent dehydrogenase (short-subunit alcohol dehydrogenase family)
MIQFSKISIPDWQSGYTLDDNARALIALCQHYEMFQDEVDIRLIKTYLAFIKHCMQANGQFFNYVNEQHEFTAALPKGRLIEPVDIANIVLFLASDYSTPMHGAVIDASMGLGVRPGLITERGH